MKRGPVRREATGAAVVRASKAGVVPLSAGFLAGFLVMCLSFLLTCSPVITLASSGDILRCSSTASGAPANNWSFDAAVSAEGRYVAFCSEATNLVHEDTNGKRDIFRKDLETGAVVRCSTDSSWAQVNGNSEDPAISADGRYVAFRSDATDLVSGGTAPGRYNVYRKDMQTGAVVLCSADSSGAEGGNDSHQPAMTPDGRYVAFQSWAKNLVTPATSSQQVFRKELALLLPAITSISPSSGAVGTEVTLTGTEFGSFRGSSSVSFGGTQATEYVSWSDTEIKVRVPAGTMGPVQVTVTTGAGTSNAVDFTVPTTFYFAEGYTGQGFAEYLCLGQPVDAPLDVEVTYLFRDGSTREETYTVPALSRLTVNVNGAVGQDQEVSIMCEADWPFIAERPMYFSYGPGWTGGHCEVGSTYLANRWYFAEGTTRTGFDTYICLQNPYGVDATAALTFILEDGSTVVRPMLVPATSRQTLRVNDAVGAGRDVSTVVESDGPLLAERPMYFDYHGAWRGGHVAAGVRAPKNAWYFAEGTTRGGFEEWLSLQNPGDVDATAGISLMLEDGTVLDHAVAVPARIRVTVAVPNLVGPGHDVSVAVKSDRAIVAERPLYFNYQNKWPGGHVVPGL